MIRADINYYTQTRKTNEKTKHVKRISLLPLSYTVKPPLMATALYNGHFCFVPADRPYIESYLKLSTTATAAKACLQLPKWSLYNGHFLLWLVKKAKNDPYGALSVSS